VKSHYRAVVIGGGVVGASVLYHLARFGWSDVALIERAELTAGSTWHAAAGFHALNADPNVAALQDYTIKLYREIEAESGQNAGLHMTGGVNMASDPQRWEWLKSAWAVFQSVGIETARLVTPEEIKAICPIVDVNGVLGGLYDSNEGHLDPYGTTHAYAGAAKKRGADVILRNRVLDLKPRPDGGWDVLTEQGTIVAEHVVNAAGLWAKQVGRMAGVELPVTPMEHHYFVTEDIPEVAALDKELGLAVDLDGFSYLRQERKGVLLGVYEQNPKHWNMDGAPWDYGIELIPEDIDRISPELTKAYERFPCLAQAGIRKWVNGAFTFTPDGNPLVGPVRGLKNYWVACGVMAGFSQGGGVGKSLAEWMIHGEPQADIFGMDIARYGAFAANREYLKQTTRQFYARRFVMTFPNERLPAGRHLRDPVCDVLEHIESRHALVGQQLRGVRLGLLQDGRTNVTGLDLGTLRALHVQDRGLQHPAECRRLFGFVLLAAGEALDRAVEVEAEVAAETCEIGAACRENALAVGVVRQDVEQVLEREVGVAAGDSLAQRDMKDDGYSGGEHGYRLLQASSIVAFNG